MIFSLVREDTRCDSDSCIAHDLYVSFKGDDNVWSDPINMGFNINSVDDEFSPFIAGDDKTLYFSSDRTDGYGGTDIYITRRLDDTWLTWTTPRNLGPDINTKFNEQDYSIAASGDVVYYVSDLNGFGSTDIYRLHLPEAFRPTATAIVSGKVMDISTKQPVQAKIQYENLETGKIIGEAISNPSTGDYTIALPSGSNYGFIANALGFYPISENLDLIKLSEYKEIQKDLNLAPIKKGEIIRLNNLFFNFGKSNIRKESESELNRLFSLLQNSPNMKIEVSGHTDNIGNESSNISLSLDRATAIKEFLVTKGIQVGRISVKGYGKSKPIAGNDTDEGRQKNRRVEFVILSE
ncbi:MAG: OmpA family protein [Ignavibacteria bacterium]|nr:OmpA family protein [Ignavibacteria bacterium]